MSDLVDEIGGEPMQADNDEVPAKPTYDAPRAYCLLAKQELGLETFDLETTVRDTVDSYYAVGLLGE